MAVGLLPFVILTMMIERFFVLIEESGARAALRTAAGSAAVAAITHELIHFEFSPAYLLCLSRASLCGCRPSNPPGPLYRLPAFRASPLPKTPEVIVNWKAARYLEELGILGMNRRKAEYIMRFNPRSLFPRVDDKVLTKQLALEHHIPTPPLYHIIECHGDIAGFEKALSGRHQFVVKPARGSGGGGIVLVTDRSSEGFVKPSGEVISKGGSRSTISPGSFQGFIPWRASKTGPSSKVSSFLTPSLPPSLIKASRISASSFIAGSL